MRSFRPFRLSAVLLVGWVAAGACFGENLVPNPSFDLNSSPSKVPGWTLDGVGRWDSRAGKNQTGAIGLSSGEERGRWRSKDFEVTPGATYRMTVSVGGSSVAGGSVNTGFSGVSLSHPLFSDEWTVFRDCFRIPSGSAHGGVHISGSKIPGTAFADDVEFVRVEPIHLRKDGFVLGEGERVIENFYVFEAPFATELHNESRPLHSFSSASFGGHAWHVPKNARVTYRHTVGGRPWKYASLHLRCSWHKEGSADVEFSENGTDWSTIGAISSKGPVELDVPFVRRDTNKPFEPTSFFIRLRGNDHSDLTVSEYRIEGELGGAPARVDGRTFFAEVRRKSPKLDVRLFSFGEALPGGNNEVSFRVENKTDSMILAQARVSVRSKGAFKDPSGSVSPLTIPAGQAVDVTLPYAAPAVGENTIELSLGDLYEAARTVVVPAFFDTSHGELFPAASPKVFLWGASSGRKIPRKGFPPKKRGGGLSLCLARNESEAVQLVLAPRVALSGVKATVSALRHAETGATLPADAVEVFRVGYERVDRASDATGAAGDWPDALYAQGEGFSAPAGENRPLWIRVKAPVEAAAGVYRGTVTVRAGEELLGSIPLTVGVFDFTLPERASLSCVVKTSKPDDAAARAPTRLYGAKMDAHDAPANTVVPSDSPETVAARHVAGQPAWWRISGSLRAPYPTACLDHPATDLRFGPWFVWMKKGDGLFVDAHLPLGSIRLEALRDGLEDYEYLALLQRKIEEKRGTVSSAVLNYGRGLLAVPKTVARSATDFAKDPLPYERHRVLVGRFLEKLQ